MKALYNRSELRQDYQSSYHRGQDYHYNSSSCTKSSSVTQVRCKRRLPNVLHLEVEGHSWTVFILTESGFSPARKPPLARLLRPSRFPSVTVRADRGFPSVGLALAVSGNLRFP